MTREQLQLWDRFMAFIADNISLPAQFDAWFKPLKPISIENGDLTIEVPSAYFIEHIEENYAPLVVAGLTKVFGKGITIKFRYFQVKDNADTAVNVRSTNPSHAVKPRTPGKSPFDSKTTEDFNSQLNPRYTFENYCSSLCNKVARSIAEAIAQDPRCRTFNPLFLFGPSGCGKTHLIQAIGIRIKENNPVARVLYVTARLFESQFTHFNAMGKINDFFHFYQSIDVLIIDDIQDLAGKRKTQNAFYHIFNHLIQNQKQLILSSDCPSAQLEGMEERLLSRFKQGMTAELGRPDYNLRRSVLELKAEQDGLELPDEVIEYIAGNVTDSIRELEGIVVSLIAHATVLNRDITIDLARMVIGNAIKSTRHQVNFEQITEVVAEYYEIDSDRIFTKTRKREISDARQLVMYLAKKHTKMSLKAIGLKLDRTHATVLYACNQTEERLAIDKKLAQDLEAIEKSLKI